MENFYRIGKLPPYVFQVIDKIKMEARRRGEDIIDFGMGNPDQPPSQQFLDKLKEAIDDPKNHRYSMSKGILPLREAICRRYKRNYNIDLDAETEAIVTIGSKEGLAHLLLAIITPADTVLVPNPTYPIHLHGVVIAGGHLCSVPLTQEQNFLESLYGAYKTTWPRPRILILNFPHNPTTQVVDLGFFKKIVEFAKEHQLIVIHDFAYADLCFDGYVAPSILQVKGAKDVAVELFTMSKSYNMPGWRVGFVVGNKEVITALQRIKSYMDYGIFQPIQIAATVALNSSMAEVHQVRDTYQNRRDTLIHGLHRIGWEVESPRGTMFVWAKIPEPYIQKGSLEFCKMLIEKCKVAVAPGIGFGDLGEGYVRFALVENEHRAKQAIRGLKQIF